MCTLYTGVCLGLLMCFIYRTRVPKKTLNHTGEIRPLRHSPLIVISGGQPAREARSPGSKLPEQGSNLRVAPPVRELELKIKKVVEVVIGRKGKACVTWYPRWTPKCAVREECQLGTGRDFT